MLDRIFAELSLIAAEQREKFLDQISPELDEPVADGQRAIAEILDNLETLAKSNSDHAEELRQVYAIERRQREKNEEPSAPPLPAIIAKLRAEAKDRERRYQQLEARLAELRSRSGAGDHEQSPPLE